MVAAIAEHRIASVSADAGPAYPGWRSAAWFMVLLFLAANLYNIDRLIVAVLAEPIKQDLRISDVQISLLIGAAYSLLSCACGTLGPLLVALLTETLFGQDRMIGASLLIVVAPALLAALGCYLMAARGVRAHLARGSLVARVIDAADAA